MRRGANSDLILSAFLLGLSIVTVSCGDFQDPAPASSTGVTVISRSRESAFTSMSQEPQSSGTVQNGQLVPNQALSSGTSGTVPSPDTSSNVRPVTFSWDPSISQDVLGYKIYLVARSAATQQRIDVGPATNVTVPLKVDETYEFTVTAYNASFESDAVQYVVFHVFRYGSLG